MLLFSFFFHVYVHFDKLPFLTKSSDLYISIWGPQSVFKTSFQTLFPASYPSPLPAEFIDPSTARSKCPNQTLTDKGRSTISPT